MKKPNILFIMTDQQRYDTLGCHGGRVHTPNLDSLAAQSADLRAFFTQAPVCVPSRCNLFTGRYSHSHRVRQNHARLPHDEVHLFKVLKQAGYYSGYIEKNHLLADQEMRNFDYLDMEEQRSHDEERTAFWQFRASRLKALSEQGAWASAAFHDFDEKHTDTWISGESACAFLDTVPADKPFCLTVSFADPHVPHIAPRRFEQMYPLDQMELPGVPAEALNSKAPRFRIKRHVQQIDQASEQDKKRYLAVYYSMISFVDEQIGKILARLDQKNLRDNTIIVFTSDHGDFAFNYDMCKKDLVLLDVLLHVNCLISFPKKIKSGIYDKTMAEQIDIVPTLLDLCGLEIPFGCQGASLMPLLSRQCTRHKDKVYAEICPPHYRNPYHTPEEFLAAWNTGHADPAHPLYGTSRFNIPGDYLKMVRTPTHKYIWYAGGFEELYNLTEDAEELVNLAGDNRYAEIKTTLKEKLLLWNLETEDPRDSWHQGKQELQYSRWLRS